MTLEDFIARMVADKSLSYREKMVLVYLRAVNDWVCTKEIMSTVTTSGNPTNSADFMKTMYDRGLLERRGTRPTGYYYKVKS